jgi:hypothetical protein
VIVRGFAGDRAGAPVPSWRPFRSVIETTAKRGSTVSENVRQTSPMPCGAIRLAAGVVARSDACPHAAGAMASTPTATRTAATAAARARRLT